MNQTRSGSIIMESRHRALLTMKVAFCSLHELKNPQFSEAKNKEIFGKCVRTHGHNYGLEVTVLGDIDQDSGFCCQRDKLAEVLERVFVKKFHGTHLNSFFKSTTGESLAEEFFKIAKENLKGFALVGVKLHETEKNLFSFGAFPSLP